MLGGIGPAGNGDSLEVNPCIREDFGAHEFRTGIRVAGKEAVVKIEIDAVAFVEVQREKGTQVPPAREAALGIRIRPGAFRELDGVVGHQGRVAGPAQFIVKRIPFYFISTV